MNSSCKRHEHLLTCVSLGLGNSPLLLSSFEVFLLKAPELLALKRMPGLSSLSTHSLIPFTVCSSQWTASDTHVYKGLPPMPPTPSVRELETRQRVVDFFFLLISKMLCRALANPMIILTNIKSMASMISFQSSKMRRWFLQILKPGLHQWIGSLSHDLQGFIHLNMHLHLCRLVMHGSVESEWFRSSICRGILPPGGNQTLNFLLKLSNVAFWRPKETERWCNHKQRKPQQCNHKQRNPSTLQPQAKQGHLSRIQVQGVVTSSPDGLPKQHLGNR